MNLNSEFFCKLKSPTFPPIKEYITTKIQFQMQMISLLPPFLHLIHLLRDFSEISVRWAPASFKARRCPGYCIDFRGTWAIVILVLPRTAAGNWVKQLFDTPWPGFHLPQDYSVEDVRKFGKYFAFRWRLVWFFLAADNLFDIFLALRKEDGRLIHFFNIMSSFYFPCGAKSVTFYGINCKDYSYP